ncbi:hypothetical protein BHM03_00032459 [Ensete ventricosum]|nr:hypothetical protein BHM03_00032459 [Ensete ventricosum]
MRISFPVCSGSRRFHSLSQEHTQPFWFWLTLTKVKLKYVQLCPLGGCKIQVVVKLDAVAEGLARFDSTRMRKLTPSIKRGCEVREKSVGPSWE